MNGPGYPEAHAKGSQKRNGSGAATRKQEVLHYIKGDWTPGEQSTLIRG